MKVTIDKNELYLDPEIIVKCKEIDDVLQDIISYIGIADKNMIGEVDGEIFFIPLNSNSNLLLCKTSYLTYNIIFKSKKQIRTVPS